MGVGLPLWIARIEVVQTIAIELEDMCRTCVLWFHLRADRLGKLVWSFAKGTLMCWCSIHVVIPSRSIDVY